MALGGGVFVTQNKTMPGAYINFVNASKATSTIGDRGVVAIPLALGKASGTVIEITRDEFLKNSQTILGIEYSSDTAKPLREIFCHATKCVIYDLGEDNTTSEVVTALEPYDFNVLAIYSNIAVDVSAYISAVKTWREDGKKVQAVAYNPSTKPDHEGIINLVSTVSDSGAVDYSLVAWVAGALAGCEINKSCTNMIYDGEYAVVCNRSQSELATCIESGQFVFHLVYGDVRVLEDINSLTTTDDDKGEDFKFNQTIRVIDQTANDIAKLFNTKYLGRVPNNASGRVSLWGDIVSYHRQMETIQAIEDFDSNLVTVEAGNNKRSVVVNDAIKPVNAMSILYMTIVIS